MTKEYINLKLTELEYLINKSVLTGSRAWDVNVENSDYDYLILDEDFKVVKIPNADTSYQFIINGLEYHFIVKDKKDFKTWKIATEILKRLCGIGQRH